MGRRTGLLACYAGFKRKRNQKSHVKRERDVNTEVG